LGKTQGHRAVYEKKGGRLPCGKKNCLWHCRRRRNVRTVPEESNKRGEPVFLKDVGKVCQESLGGQGRSGEIVVGVLSKRKPSPGKKEKEKGKGGMWNEDLLRGAKTLGEVLDLERPIRGMSREKGPNEKKHRTINCFWSKKGGQKGGRTRGFNYSKRLSGHLVCRWWGENPSRKSALKGSLGRE